MTDVGKKVFTSFPNCKPLLAIFLKTAGNPQTAVHELLMPLPSSAATFEPDQCPEETEEGQTSWLRDAVDGQREVVTTRKGGTVVVGDRSVVEAKRVSACSERTRYVE